MFSGFLSPTSISLDITSCLVRQSEELPQLERQYQLVVLLERKLLYFPLRLLISDCMVQIVILP